MSLNSTEKSINSSVIKIGIVGLSVHTQAFTEILNSPTGKDFFGCKVIAYYAPEENDDVAFSKAKVLEFEASMERHKVIRVSSLDEVINMTDALMVLTNDGRPHLSEVVPILAAGKRIFLDKPVAENWINVKKIFRASERYNVPVFSASALRYGSKIQELSNTRNIGTLQGAETYGPAPIQSSHIDLFWDGIHGIEMLYTIMGTGCQSVTQVSTAGCDLVVGKWAENRIGIFRGIRSGKISFGGTAFRKEGIESLGTFDGYDLLVKKIAEFFALGELPVPIDETLEIYSFMEAAFRSKKQGGKEVKLRYN